MSGNLQSREIADYFLANVEEDSGDNLTNLKLQKLVYFSQGFSLAMRDEPVFSEPIEAWEQGPVAPRLYQVFEQRGNRPIDPPHEFEAAGYPPEVREILDAVRVVYGQFSAWKLRDLTLGEPPWRETPRSGEISHRALREFFSRVVEAGREDRAIPGEPAWPTNTFLHQRRKEIMGRTPGRERLRAALSRAIASGTGPADRD